MNVQREQVVAAFEAARLLRPQRVIIPTLLAVGMLSVAWAGNKTSVTADGWGKVESSVSYSAPVAVASYSTATFSALAAAPSGSLKEAKNPPPAGTSGTTQVNVPNAGVNPSGTFAGVVTNLPSGCPSSVFCTVTTTALTGGYKAVVRSYVTGGAVADNAELDVLLDDLTAPNCASYTVTNDVLVVPNGTTGELIVTGEATDGTAIRFEGYELTGYAYGNVRVDPDLNQEVRDGPSQEQIRDGSKKYSVLLRGPFNYTVECPLRIPFTYSGKPENLHTTIDAIAKSTPFEFICPSAPLELDCDDIPQELELVGGCGEVITEYFPPLNELPGGSSWVTAIATDGVGNLATCQFEVVRGVLEFNGFYPPIGGSSVTGTEGSCLKPLRRINAGNKIPIKFDATICGVPYSPTAPPKVSIYKVSSCGQPDGVLELEGNFQQVANEWHFNWQTTPFQQGTYRIEVELNDSEDTLTPFAWVQLR